MNALGPGIEWQLPEMENVPFAGTWRGHDGVGRFLQILTETQEISNSARTSLSHKAIP